MIRIAKPRNPPAILRNRGTSDTTKFKRSYSAAPEDYRSGEKKFSFDSSIYGAKSVKNALVKAQHGKCCFCESKILHVSYGDVEHFRPKGAWRQSTSERKSYPGYYWLAYEWKNLFLACQICNQRHKGNLFPIATAQARARSHNDDLDQEDPLFLDPGKDDPIQFIGFRQEFAYALAGNTRGRTAIKALGLNRPELVEVRRDQLDKLWALKFVANSGSPDSDKARKLIDASILPPAEYSSMARAFLSEEE